MLERDRSTCQLCGQRAPDVPVDVDHIVPFAEGGRSTMANLRTLCLSCHRGKTATQKTRVIRIADDSGTERTVAEWANLSGLRAKTIKQRLRRGWTPQRAIWAPRGTGQGGSNKVFLTDNTGKRASVKEWSEITGTSHSAIQYRRLRGWSEHDAIWDPDGRARDLQTKKLTDHSGATRTAREWEAVSGVSKHTILGRVKRGMSDHDAIWTPVGKSRLAPRTFTDNSGATHTIKEWAQITGTPLRTIHRRIRDGWPVHEAIHGRGTVVPEAAE